MIQTDPIAGKHETSNPTPAVATGDVARVRLAALAKRRSARASSARWAWAGRMHLRGALVYGLMAVGTVALAACGTSTPSTTVPADTAVVPPTVAQASIAATSTSEPASTPTPSPVPSPTPSPLPASATATTAPTFGPPALVDTPTAQARLATRLADEAWARLVTLTELTSPRSSATEREKAAADYLAGQLEAMGYATALQPFSVDVLVTDPPVFSLESFRDLDVRGNPLQGSARGRVSGFLADVGKAFEGEVLGMGIEGKIALIERGAITFEEKVARVAKAGARAAVVYNDRRGRFGGTLGNESDLLVVAISQADGEAILKLMGEGEVEATISIVVESRETRNVIAEKRGTAGDGSVVVIGGHYDTVPGVPGANDNGSGIAALLTVASEVADKDYPFTLRFIPFGSEELGLRGSGFYVSSLTPEEVEDTLAMVNLDALGTGDVTGILGDFELIGKIVEYGTAHGLEVERRVSLDAGTSSDHASFAEAGIRVVFFMADDFSRIHTDRDTIEFVAPELMGISAALTIALLDILAESE